MANGARLTPTLDFPGYCTLGAIGYDAAGRLVFVTDTRHAVLTQGATASADIVLKSAR